jgi:transporter family protein
LEENGKETGCIIFTFKFPYGIILLSLTKYDKGDYIMWFVFALLSAVFAALTSILAKVGIEGVNSNLATAIRTMVVVLMSWGMVFLTNAQGGITEISKKSWIFLVLSGIATGASWLCYYRALQIGEVSKVVPIDKLSVVITLVLSFVLLGDKFTPKSLIGCLLLCAGTLVMAL